MFPQCIHQVFNTGSDHLLELTVQSLKSLGKYFYSNRYTLILMEMYANRMYRNDTHSQGIGTTVEQLVNSNKECHRGPTTKGEGSVCGLQERCVE